MTSLHFDLLQQAEELLRPLGRKTVFVGGASVALHIDDAAVKLRATKDVDFVVEVAGYAENAKIEETLRSLGFVQGGADDAPICRWHKDGLMLDMMPTDPTILGFGASDWFKEGFENAEVFTLPNGVNIEAFSALYLIAAKIEAYRDRGHGEWLTSKDVEDIVTLLDGRSLIFEEIAVAGAVQRFISSWFLSFPLDELEEIFGAHLADYDRGSLLIERLLECCGES